MDESITGGDVGFFPDDQLDIVVADLLGFFLEFDSEHRVVDAVVDRSGWNLDAPPVGEKIGGPSLSRWLMGENRR